MHPASRLKLDPPALERQAEVRNRQPVKIGERPPGPGQMHPIYSADAVPKHNRKRKVSVNVQEQEQLTTLPSANPVVYTT